MEKPKLCPICGSMPVLEKESMDYGNGHGYPGNFNYKVSCDCGAMKGHESGDTVYCKSHEKAKEKAIKSWNEEVDKVEKLLEWRNNMPNSEMYWYQKLLYCIAIGMTDESIAKQFDISTKMVNNIKEYYLKEGEKIKCQTNSKNKH